jgi:hypothetical protein
MLLTSLSVPRVLAIGNWHHSAYQLLLVFASESFVIWSTSLAESTNMNVSSGISTQSQSIYTLAILALTNLRRYNYAGK